MRLIAEHSTVRLTARLTVPQITVRLTARLTARLTMRFTNCHFPGPLAPGCPAAAAATCTCHLCSRPGAEKHRPTAHTQQRPCTTMHRRRAIPGNRIYLWNLSTASNGIQRQSAVVEETNGTQRQPTASPRWRCASPMVPRQWPNMHTTHACFVFC